MENSKNPKLNESEPIQNLLFVEEEHCSDVEGDSVEVQEKIVSCGCSIDQNVVDELTKFLVQFEDGYQDAEPSLKIMKVLELFASRENLCKKLSDENRRIAELLSDNPRVYLLLENLLKGESVSVALIKSDLMDVMPSADDDDYKEYVAASAQLRERNVKAKEMARLREERCEECSRVSDQFYSEVNASDEQIVQFVKFIEKIIDNFFTANIDAEMMKVLWSAFTFDEEIVRAQEQGRIDGRNELIKQRRRSSSDGIPAQSATVTVEEKNSRMGYIERLLNNR